MATFLRHDWNNRAAAVTERNLKAVRATLTTAH